MGNSNHLWRNKYWLNVIFGRVFYDWITDPKEREISSEIAKETILAIQLGRFSLVPIGLLGWGNIKNEPFVFARALEMWIANILS